MRLQVCPPATREDIARFRAAMTVCFRRAVEARLSIAVSPRLDDGLGIGGWRNGEKPVLAAHAHPECPTTTLRHARSLLLRKHVALAECEPIDWSLSVQNTDGSY